MQLKSPNPLIRCSFEAAWASGGGGCVAGVWFWLSGRTVGSVKTAELAAETASSGSDGASCRSAPGSGAAT